MFSPKERGEKHYKYKKYKNKTKRFLDEDVFFENNHKIGRKLIRSLQKYDIDDFFPLMVQNTNFTKKFQLIEHFHLEKQQNENVNICLNDMTIEYFMPLALLQKTLHNLRTFQYSKPTINELFSVFNKNYSLIFEKQRLKYNYDLQIFYNCIEIKTFSDHVVVTKVVYPSSVNVGYSYLPQNMWWCNAEYTIYGISVGYISKNKKYVVNRLYEF
jgi:hypothetical protein